MDEGKKRTIEVAAEITTPIDQVWKALTDAEEITPPHAQSKPGPEGHIWVSWGEGASGGARIAIWEPPAHLQLEQLAPNGSRKPEPIVVDYLLETLSGETTLLRIVNSGFSAGSDFDDEYDSTWNGQPSPC